MGALRAIAAALVAAPLLAAPALAAEDDWPVLKSARLDGLPPWGAFVVYPAADKPSAGVSLYVRRAGETPFLLARRVRVRPGEEAARIDWAAGPDCPALPAAVARMEELPPPRIDAPLVGREPADITVVADGASYFLWSSFARYSGGAPGELEVRTVEGTPAAAWIDETLAALEPCWGAGPP